MPEDPTYTQANHRLRVQTPLGEDELILTSFSGNEEISRLFQYQLDFVSENHSINPRDILGHPVSIHMELDDQERYFHGIVSQFCAGASDKHDLRYFQADMVPWLWFLTRNQDSRIFQNQSVPEIIEQILKQRGFTDYELAASQEHPKLEYCVQYRESDFNFISRLMEEEGLFYSFRHDERCLTLIIADQNEASHFWEDPTVSYVEGSSDTTHVYSWEHRYEYMSGKWAQTDYNFQKPANGNATPSDILLTNENSLVSLHNNNQFEVFDFPAEYQEIGVGRAKTRIRMEEEEVPHDVAVGSSTCAGFNPLAKFTLQDHEFESENQSYLLTSVQHSGSEPAQYLSGSDASNHYSNSFVCIPDSVTYRPERISRKPIVVGSQTAVVTGPSGEEIWPDEFGRIKVQFYWDREGKRDENSSCWIRCAQNIAGKQWGTMFIPRVGQEVVVTFLEGDPDRPLVTGVVYNSEQMPPYELPAQKTKSYIKTNSSTGGDGYNEIRFEDKRGEEQIFMHAQRAMDVRVQSTCKERVLGDRHMIVGAQDSGHQVEKVHGHKHLMTQGEHIERIDQCMQRTVGDYQETVVKGDKYDLAEKDHEVHVIGNRIEKIDGNLGVTAGNSIYDHCTNRQVSADNFIDMRVDGGCWINIDPGRILLCSSNGSNFIKINDAGIQIEGTTVDINCGASKGPSGHVSPPPDPIDAREANPVEPMEADNSVSGQKSAPDSLS